MDVRETIRSQYLAALEMLKEVIVACPDEQWHRTAEENKFWQVAYHALFYTHLYLQETEEAFAPWSGHREAYRLGQWEEAPPAEAEKEAEKEAEAAPVTPATKDDVLAYLAFCQREVVAQVATADFEAASGFYWLPFKKLELQLYSIRHIQQHVGELMERLGPRAGEIDWVGSKREVQ